MPPTDPATAESVASQDAVDALLREVLPPQGGWSDYVEHGVFGRGDAATSALLGGVAVDVTALFDEAAE